jgi:hypothetical protein
VIEGPPSLVYTISELACISGVSNVQKRDSMEDIKRDNGVLSIIESHLESKKKIFLGVWLDRKESIKEGLSSDVSSSSLYSFPSISLAFLFSILLCGLSLLHPFIWGSFSLAFLFLWHPSM